VRSDLYFVILLHSLFKLGALEKFLKAIITFFMYIRLFRPSVRMEQLGSYWTDFYEIWYLNIFRKYVAKIQESLKHDQKKGAFYMKTN